MSRHTFFGQQPHHQIVVGWDPALQSYFVQVEDHVPSATEDVTIGDSPEEGLLLWEGADRVIETLADIERLLLTYGTIPSELKERLIHDRETNSTGAH